MQCRGKVKILKAACALLDKLIEGHYEGSIEWMCDVAGDIGISAFELQVNEASCIEHFVGEAFTLLEYLWVICGVGAEAGSGGPVSDLSLIHI